MTSPSSTSCSVATSHGIGLCLQPFAFQGAPTAILSSPPATTSRTAAGFDADADDYWPSVSLRKGPRSREALAARGYAQLESSQRATSPWTRRRPAGDGRERRGAHHAPRVRDPELSSATRQVLSKEQIHDAAWGDGADRRIRVVEVYAWQGWSASCRRRADSVSSRPAESATADQRDAAELL